MTDTAKIAAGLKYHQRNVIRGLSSDWRDAGTCSAFLGYVPILMESRYDKHSRKKQYRLTPLGLAVRDYLKEHGHAE